MTPIPIVEPAHLKRRTQAIIAVVYFTIALFIGELIGPSASAWTAPLIAVVFVVVYVTAGKGHSLAPMVLVALATLVVPMSFLAFVGIPAYGSLSAFARAIVSVPGFISPLAIVDMVCPLLASMTTVVVLKVAGSDKALEPSGEA